MNWRDMIREACKRYHITAEQCESLTYDQLMILLEGP
jgi:hypothetical protein